jgi:hypothetical protein
VYLIEGGIKQGSSRLFFFHGGRALYLDNDARTVGRASIRASMEISPQRGAFNFRHPTSQQSRSSPNKQIIQVRREDYWLWL